MKNKSNYKKPIDGNNLEAEIPQKEVVVSRGNMQSKNPTSTKQNVVDLRSIIAKKEAQALQAQRANTPKKKEKKLFSLRNRRQRPQSTPRVSRDPLVQETVTELPTPVETFKKPKNTKLLFHHLERRKKVRKRNDSLFQRPVVEIEQEDIQHIDIKELPSSGFSFHTVVKPLTVFVILALIVSGPANVSAVFDSTKAAEDAITENAQQAFNHLSQAVNTMQQLDYDTAQKEFETANTYFIDAQKQIDELNQLIVMVAPLVPGKGKQFTAGKHLVQSGIGLSLAGEEFAKTMKELTATPLSEQAQNEQVGLTGLLLVMNSGLTPAVEHMNTANAELAKVSIQDVPAEHRDIVIQAQKMMPIAAGTLQDGLDNVETVLQFLGNKEQKRYAVLFANNHEIRPCGGGFIGSFGLFDVYNGVVTGSDIPGGGIYDVAGQTQARIVAPQPLQLVNGAWNIQDANWFPHFPSCAQKLEWFLGHSNQQVSVDGVISFTPTIIEQLLETTGPIDMEEMYGTTISADNFYSVIQEQAEKKFDEDPKSKRIIGDLTPKLFEKVFSSAQDPKQIWKLVEIVRKGVEQKEIVLYSNDSNVQEAFSKHNWAGEIMQTDGDYLHVNVANIGGGKTTQAIDHSLHLKTAIDTQGNIVDTATFQMVHKGASGDQFDDVNNFSFVRFYIPEGAEILSVNGFQQPDPKLFFPPPAGYTVDQDIQKISGNITVDASTGVQRNTEFGKQVIGGWMLTAVGESTQVTIEYRLPQKIRVGTFWHTSDHYSLLLQKQSGLNMLVQHELLLPDNLQVHSTYPENNFLNTPFVLDQDNFSGVVFKEKK